MLFVAPTAGREQSKYHECDVTHRRSIAQSFGDDTCRAIEACAEAQPRSQLMHSDRF